MIVRFFFFPPSVKAILTLSSSSRVYLIELRSLHLALYPSPLANVAHEAVSPKAAF